MALSSSPAVAPTTSSAARLPRLGSHFESPICGWPGRGTCWLGSRRCASSSRPRGSSSCRGSCAARCCRRTIGVVTAETGAARRDLLAGLRRRGWAGTVVWAFAPVQDRHAAPAITAAIQDLAAQPQVEAIVVTRGGGSLADLWAFCDETLCRTVAMLRVPVVSAVGHERDSTLIDDVAAVACSTPTHAAEAVVPLDCGVARLGLERSIASLSRAAEGAVRTRTPHLVALARGPARALRRERLALNQKTREIRAASERGVAERLGFQRRLATVVLSERAAGPKVPKWSAGERRCTAPRSPCGLTNPSAPSSAATRWSRTARASR